MLRTTIPVFLILTSITVVSALIVPLDTHCSKAEYLDDDMEEWIKNGGGNCLDIVCAVIDSSGRPIRVSDGTEDANDAEPLWGNQSYLLTTATTDLRNIAGECATRAFNASYCSVRDDWRLEVAIVRHYDRADGQDEGEEWDPDIEGRIFPWEPPRVSGVQYEVATKRISNAYRCEDTLPPQLLYEERFDVLTGERTIEITFNDNEWEYVTESGDTINLLMDFSEDEEPENRDTTKLDSCAYAITESSDRPGSGSWNLVECEGQRTYSLTVTLPRDEYGVSGLFLHMRAEDSKRNDDERAYALQDYYEALGDGYCPRANECLITPGTVRYEGISGTSTLPGADLENNTFANYLTQGRKPVCVLPGHGAGNVYCSESGTIERSQALFEYGISQLSGSGTVYCGIADEVSGVNTGTTQKRCSGLPHPHDEYCSLSCVVSLSTQADEWQQSAAIFAANNFLRHSIENREGDPLIYTPTAFTSRVNYLGTNNRYLDTRSCSISGDELSCDVWMTMGQEGHLDSTASVVYHNRSGLAGVSQTMSLSHPSPDTISTGRLDEGTMNDFITRLNTYIADIARDEAPQYDARRLSELTRIAAYQTDGTRTIIAVSTRGFEFTPRTGAGGTTRVVAVLFDGFSSSERDYINQAKDAITTVTLSPNPIRTNTLKPLEGQENGAYMIFLSVRDTDASVHEMIEQLAVRPRVGS